MIRRQIVTGVCAVTFCLYGWWLPNICERPAVHAAETSNTGKVPRAEISRDLQVLVRTGKPEYVVGAEVTMNVELRNVGSADVVLDLGVMLANGKEQYPTAIHLSLVDGTGKERRLLPIQPSHVGGRMDPFLVPLPVGATYIIATSLSDYWCPDTKEFQIQPMPGHYTIAAFYNGQAPTRVNIELAGAKLITGEVSSDATVFSVVSK